MAGHGPPPKGRRARDRDSADVVELVATVELHGEPLPEGVLPGGEEWHQQTVALWDALRSSALLKDEPALGWQFLVDTALMHHTMWTKGRWEFASEVRLRVAKFGATPEDRMRLKVKVTSTSAAPVPAAVTVTAGVTNLGDRRGRLIGA